MKKPAQHLIAEVPPRQPRLAMTIGIDLGDVWSHYCTLNQDGEVVDRGRFRTTPKAIEKWFTDVPPARVVMEAGTHSIWISEQLQELGHEVIVANVRELRAISHELARMEPSWHVLGPEPARFGPAPGQDRKSLAYERMQRFSTQIIRSPAMPQKFSGMLPHANAWQPTRKCAAH